MRGIVSLLTIAVFGTAMASGVAGPLGADWTAATPAGGSVSISTSAIDITGGDIGVAGDATATTTGLGGQSGIGFSYDWVSLNSTAGFDTAFYSINGAKTTLPGTTGPAFSGSVSGLSVPAAGSLAVGVTTLDGIFGPGVLNTSKWVPEPASLSVLALGVLAALRRR